MTRIIKRIALKVLGLDENNMPKPQVVERVVYRDRPVRQSGAPPDPMKNWK